MEGDPDALFEVFDEAATPVKSKKRSRKSRGGSKPNETVKHTARKVAKLSESDTNASDLAAQTVADRADIHQLPQSIEQRVIRTKTLEKDGCMAIRCFPPDWDPTQDTDTVPVVTKPAKVYPFTLDPFQQESVNCLEKNQSVLVAAHTSAGKTVVAEYAIAMSLRDQQRVIYTSPIKALSNQKYRELQQEFEDVGLMTGDTTINPSASCLVMTTEILRNMLYRGSEIMREVAWVVFDEIHYMRDKERGVVWEETIIMLPHKVRYVFLSATIPNADEFAMWIAKVHKQPCNVVYTDYRPTPLQHYLFPSGGEGLYLVVDDKGKFRENNFQKALAVIGNTDEDAGGDDNGGGDSKKKRRKSNRKQTGNDMYKIVRMIMERRYHPVIVFAFSKRQCEANALQMSKLDFCDENEKTMIGQVFHNAIDSLCDDDKKLPQVENILPLLKRGIGIHHGGLLPILKEIVELLFQEGFIKCLFATETFAMGLNMPAKTVVFTALRKFDGQDFRLVRPGEYIQMSGRAGRRGLDDRGIVIMMMDEKIEPAESKEMIQGQAEPLLSQFHLGYNMLLNLLRVEEADPQFMMQRSFRQFQSNRAAPRLLLEAKEKKEEKKNLAFEVDVGDIASYYHIISQLGKFKEQIKSHINAPINALPFLNPGRLAQVREPSQGGHNEKNWGYGVIVNFTKFRASKDVVLGLNTLSSQKSNSSSSSGMDADTTYVVHIVLQCHPDSISKDKPSHKQIPAPFPQDASAAKGLIPVPRVLPVLLHCLDGLSNIRIFMPADLSKPTQLISVNQSLQEVKRRFPDGIPLLDPIDDYKIQDSGFLKAVSQVETLEDRLLNHPLYGKDILAQEIEKYEKKLNLEKQIYDLEDQVKKASQDVVMMGHLKGMKRVLRRLGCTTSENVIDLKGRVACQVSTCDELVATELMFGGVFNDLSPEYVVALCSCLVFTERNEEKVTLPEDLAGPFRKLTDVAKRIAQVKLDAKLPCDVEEYVGQFKPHMMEVVLKWCQGSKFSDICSMTEVFEGSIIRGMRRLEELLRQFGSAAKSIGNEPLEKKFHEGIDKIKRDIVFAASLYL